MARAQADYDIDFNNIDLDQLSPQEVRVPSARLQRCAAAHA
jgi:hypothetical protein